MAVDTSAVILLSNFKIAEAISSTPVSPILAFASILIGFKNFFPQDAPAINRENETGYNPTSKIAPPAKFLLKSL